MVVAARESLAKEVKEGGRKKRRREGGVKPPEPTSSFFLDSSREHAYLIAMWFSRSVGQIVRRRLVFRPRLLRRLFRLRQLKFAATAAATDAESFTAISASATSTTPSAVIKLYHDRCFCHPYHRISHLFKSYPDRCFSHHHHRIF